MLGQFNMFKVYYVQFEFENSLKSQRLPRDESYNFIANISFLVQRRRLINITKAVLLLKNVKYCLNRLEAGTQFLDRFLAAYSLAGFSLTP